MDFFYTHAQINDVRYGDDFDFNAETELKYPVAQIEYITDRISRRQSYSIYKITLVDRIDDNIVGMEDDIYSDMRDIAFDFVAWLRNQEGWTYTEDINLVKIINDGGDRFAGFEFQISIASIMPLNECAKPLPTEYIP